MKTANKLKKLKFNDVYKALEEDKLTPYNFYNIDLASDQVFSIDHYLSNEEYDNIDTVQPLKKVFIDIEVFLNHKIGKSIADMVMQGTDLVNAISQYYSSENTFYVYLVPPKGCNLTAAEFEEYLNKESSKPVKIGEENGEDILGTYFEEGQKCIVKLFDIDKDLIIDMWEKIKKDDPAVLSGWNSDGFDYPFLYHRLLTLLGSHEEVSKVMSKFECDIEDTRDRAGNSVHRIRLAEYNIVDLMYSYKDRADGGLGLGKKSQSYALNAIAQKELGLIKYEYKAEGLTLDQLYEQDPLNFALYNLWDTVLAYKIDKKAGLIDLYNMQRRKMECPLGPALRGSSPLFDTHFYGDLKKSGKYIRWGINSENNFSIPSFEIDALPKPKTLMKMTWNISEMSVRECSKALTRYPGAYVKDPIPGIYDTGIVSDLDKHPRINESNVYDKYYHR